MLITGSACGKVINMVNKGEMEPIPEGETKLEVIEISSLLDQGSKGVSVFIKCSLSLAILVLILQSESCKLGWI